MKQVAAWMDKTCILAWDEIILVVLMVSIKKGRFVLYCLTRAVKVDVFVKPAAAWMKKTSISGCDEMIPVVLAAC